MVREDYAPMQVPYTHPLKYAEQIVALLADTTTANAEIALRLASNLIEYRARYEFSERLAVGAAEPQEPQTLPQTQLHIEEDELPRTEYA